MFSHWAYVLIGEDKTGKTTFQKDLVSYLCGKRYSRLPANSVKIITHPRAPKGLHNIFTCNRSYQEIPKYKTVQSYFKNFFAYADICILSSHSHGKAKKDVEEMIEQLKRRCYNVAGVFWDNAFDADADAMNLTSLERIALRLQSRNKEP